MAELDKDAAVGVLNRILEAELAGVVRYTHYAFLVFGFGRIPIVSWLNAQADESLLHARQAGEWITTLGAYPSLGIGPLLDSEEIEIGDRPQFPPPPALHATVPTPELGGREDGVGVCQGEQVLVAGDQVVEASRAHARQQGAEHGLVVVVAQGLVGNRLRLDELGLDRQDVHEVVDFAAGKAVAGG